MTGRARRLVGVNPARAARLGLTVGVAGVVGGTDGDGLADPDGEGLGP